VIIDFSVSNFRSFRKEQQISFIASNYDKALPGNLIELELPRLEGMKLLRAVGLYGANASGKTNVLEALKFLGKFVATSATRLDEGDETGAEPFLLHPAASEQPSEFALRFVVDGVRYHFALVVNRKRVLYECLAAFPNGREQTWYERSWNEEKEEYDWAPKRSTAFKRDARIVGYTRSNASFLSTAAKWNNDQIKPVFRWFRQNLRFFGTDFASSSLSIRFTTHFMQRGPDEQRKIERLLRHGDIGVLSAKVTEYEFAKEDLPTGLPEELIRKILDGKKRIEVNLEHRGASGRGYPLSWKYESSGTKRLFSLAGPWLDILENGYVAGVDEIESSMHPAMAVELLRLVFNPDLNRGNAQILFTTHNPLLLDQTLLRRDQIWFADKDDEGGTHLYPLSDYKPRKGESLVRGYLAGRYGAVPFIPCGLLGKEDADGR